MKSLIDDKFNVLTFLDAEVRDAAGLTIPRPVPWTTASTFYGFCNVHDGPLFAPLETFPYTATPEQNFLIGYRAICYEKYQKLSALETIKVERKFGDRGSTEAGQRLFQRGWDRFELGVRTAIAELDTLKARYDSTIVSRDFSQFESVAILFDGNITVSTTGAIQPDFDIYGMRLQDLTKLDVPAEGLALGLTITSPGGAFVFSWPSDYQKCNRFVRMLRKVSPSHLPSHLIELSFYYLQNTYFSNVWWSGLSQTEKVRVEALAKTPSAYMSRLDYSKMKLTDWQVTSIVY